MVSVILCSTEKGERFIQKMAADGLIKVVERSVIEPLSAMGNPQLRYPSIPFKTRHIFLEEYSKKHNFENAVRKSLWKLYITYYLSYPWKKGKEIIVGKMPYKVKQRIKNWIGR